MKDIICHGVTSFRVNDTKTRRLSSCFLHIACGPGSGLKRIRIQYERFTSTHFFHVVHWLNLRKVWNIFTCFGLFRYVWDDNRWCHISNWFLDPTFGTKMNETGENPGIRIRNSCYRLRVALRCVPWPRSPGDRKAGLISEFVSVTPPGFFSRFFNKFSNFVRAFDILNYLRMSRKSTL